MNPEDLKKRTKAFAIRVVQFVESLPNDKTGNIIGNQLLRSGTSVGANYRAACRAKSRAHFISKLGDVEEELDESIYWMEIIEALGLVKTKELELLKAETNQLLAIIVSSINTARKNRAKK
ncbi:MAG TPA: four helix bundle protein [Bacteroidota bacterium]|nr:four helix bundle protein [Bacteroidota bacterium]